MSIATDEAEQWAQSRYSGSVHTERHDGRAVSVPNYPQKINLRREGYIAGRTAEPTEAETWIIARALYEWYLDLEFSTEVSDDEWESFKSYYGKTPMQCSEFIKAKKALTAMRKAVTE